MEKNSMKKICIMLGSRANYGSIKSFLENCKKKKNLIYRLYYSHQHHCIGLVILGP